ncbi:alpha/beta hydrolase family protein [Steroidobacter flavus]|uniref:Alpha/beta hydrolase family protein n=1 Tax=Steroidobacter flavus TaxID=1842136 RepID=A0ABV8T5X6_9GAMM
MALLLLLSACASPQASDSPARGTVKSVEQLSTFSRQSIDAKNKFVALSGAAQCDVQVIQVTYDSIGVRSEPVTLSAAIYVPQGCAGPFPLLAQAHGTQSDRKRSSAEVDAGNTAITFFAAQGYLVVTPDYLGLGKSDYPFHPYLHADSEASAIIDAIRAARAAARDLAIPADDRVMLFGYSQGGHAAMAAQREIERNHAGEIKLIASAPMAGPYYLSQTFLGSWFGYTAGEPNSLASELFAYTLLSYNQVYGLYSDPGEVFAAAYGKPVEQLFSGALTITEIDRQQALPAGGKLNELRNPAFSAAFLLDENQPFRRALRQNDLLDWRPAAPTILCGSSRDTVVDLQNAYAAQTAFRARGADVAVIDVADSIPPEVDGTGHHRYSMACYSAVRRQLFDPIRRGEIRTTRAR